MTKIALFQSNTGIDPKANAAALLNAISEAAGGGATMLFTPEMSGLLDRDSERASANLRVEDEDSVLAACRAAAREHERKGLCDFLPYVVLLHRLEQRRQPPEHLLVADGPVLVIEGLAAAVLVPEHDGGSRPGRCREEARDLGVGEGPSFPQPGSDGRNLEGAHHPGLVCWLR